MQPALSPVLLRMAVSVAQPWCPPTNPLPIIGWLPCANRLSCLPGTSMLDLRQVSKRSRSIPDEERVCKRVGRPFLPLLNSRGLLARPW